LSLIYRVQKIKSFVEQKVDVTFTTYNNNFTIERVCEVLSENWYSDYEVWIGRMWEEELGGRTE
jgi:hypothetical protein